MMAQCITRILLLLGLAVLASRPDPVSALFQSNPLNCEEEPGLTDLGPQCRPLMVYSQLEWARLAAQNTSTERAKFCSCRLLNLDWEAEFDDHPAVRRVYYMVLGVVKLNKYKSMNPPQIWNDIDVIVNGYSIRLSNRKFFDMVRRDPDVSFFKRSDYERENHLRDLRFLCYKKITLDPHGYYQYLENLERINPVMFYQVLHTNQMINMVYQASKACKLLILHRIQEFKVKPNETGFYAVDQSRLTQTEIEDFNELQSNNDIDLALRHLSLKLFNCKHWHYDEINLQTLERECPMMMNESLQADWLESHSEPSERSLITLNCGCKLLALNSSWVDIIKDKNLDVMSKALTRHMNQNKLPAMNSPETSTWEYFAWFDRIMGRFVKSKKASVKEIIKFRRDIDPVEEINRQTHDEADALDLLRLGCNRLMFNHIKGSKAVDPIRPIKYLDNLRYISQDPLFVFHLTLLDANLFKLYALSKMCEPVVR